MQMSTFLEGPVDSDPSKEPLVGAEPLSRYTGRVLVLTPHAREAAGRGVAYLSGM